MSSSGFPNFQSMAAKVAVALVGVSVLFALTRNSLGPFLLLTPGLFFKAMLWQPVTYGLIETTPLGVIFGALIVWSIGGALEMAWGSRRMFFFLTSVTVLAGVLTALLALAWPALWLRPFPGGTVLTSALWVGYGLSYGARHTQFWGLPMTGNVFALLGVGFVFLQGAFYDWVAIVPDAFALALTYGYFTVGSPYSLWLRLGSWRLKRKVQRKTVHLRLLEKDRNMPKDSDRYLH
jgi:hypothetical protein